MPQPILFKLQALRPGGRQSLFRKGVPPFRQAKGLPRYEQINITGVTRDSTGIALASCVVDLFRTDNDVKVDAVTSDGSGNYSFRVGPGTPYYIVAYKAGAPDVAGTTVNTLAGV